MNLETKQKLEDFGEKPRLEASKQCFFGGLTLRMPSVRPWEKAGS